MISNLRWNAALLTRWCVGLLVGTALVWASSPWFVRSYHARVFDPLLRGGCYPEGTSYRWRSEGYATSSIGPHGMVGRMTLADTRGKSIVALWGDSQAEGVSVRDDDKLGAVLEHEISKTTGQAVAVLPMGHSGEDAWDWTNRFEAAEARLAVDSHFLLICELEDLQVLAEGTLKLAYDSLAVHEDSTFLDVVPDFVVHAARGLLFDPGTNRPRRLRFGIGPNRRSHPDIDQNIDQNIDSQEEVDDNTQSDDARVISRTLAGSTERPITILYAPNVPIILGGKFVTQDVEAMALPSLRYQLNLQGIEVIDCRDVFRQAAIRGRFAHGFHNGVIGSGHLNAHGYRLIAKEVARSLAADCGAK